MNDSKSNYSKFPCHIDNFSSHIDTDSNLDKKIVKLYKAMKIMEQSKHLEPKFSESFKELARYVNEFRVSTKSAYGAAFRHLVFDWNFMF